MRNITLRLTTFLILAVSGLSCSHSTVTPSTFTPITDQTHILESLNQFPESTWLKTEEDIVNQLSLQPTECINPEIYTENSYQINVGKAAFNTPSLLGGQAARLGISCNTCHRSGQSNSGFFIAGISDNPGRLDVTHGFFSEVREDNNFNPVPIPTLLNITGKSVFGTVHPQSSLDNFIHGVIVDEFSGQEPAPEVMKAILFFVSALDDASCSPNDNIARDLQTEMAFLETTIDTLYKSIGRDDSENSSILVLAAQSLLQNMHYRYTAHPEILNGLERMSRDLRAVYRQDRDQQLFLLADWHSRFNVLKNTLMEQENNSLYNLPQI